MEEWNGSVRQVLRYDGISYCGVVVDDGDNVGGKQRRGDDDDGELNQQDITWFSAV